MTQDILTEDEAEGDGARGYEFKISKGISYVNRFIIGIS